jgi:hypothetical protein
MRVALQYLPGTVPQERSAENVQLLWTWLERLRRRPEHVLTIALADHLRVSRAASDAPAPVDFGMSVVEVDTIEDAVALTKGWPEWEWGGAIDVRAEVLP